MGIIGITPDYKIINKSSGQDLTAALKPYIISLSLQESADNQNDTLSISMNGQGINQFPPSGTQLEVLLGYKETGLVNFGVYKVDSKTLSGMPLVLSIKAGQSDFTAPIKTQKSRHFDNKNLGEILGTIAKENELELSELSPQIKDTVVPYLRQNQESDMAIIKRLAKEHSADGTVKSGRLVFKEKSAPVNIQIITPGDLVSFSINWVDRVKYGSTIAIWHDRDGNIAHEAIYDGQAFVDKAVGNVARVKKQNNSLVEAQKMAKSHWQKLHTLQLKASLNMVGNPQMTSKLGLKMQGFTVDTDNTVLYVSSVRHQISNGYKTTVEATNQSTSTTAA